MDRELQTLIELQRYDTRLAGLEADVARLPRQIEAIQAAVTETRAAVETLRAKAETTRKELRAKERDLDVTNDRRRKSEAKLYEVKTNKEYSAALLEIEEIKQVKGETEEQILGLMETQERLAADIRDAEARLRAREEQARQDEAVVRRQLAAAEAELAAVRDERDRLAAELAPAVLTNYERVLRARASLAVVAVMNGTICGGCRVAIRPQALQELRAADALRLCESCGRFLYWPE